ncbi:broad-specificity NMP kinase [Haloactinospora alba]|uniref:Broad-specificity NMP kinase n=1 Tax=Haloactinospora alba TaxID=405555 RepID=A0A543NNH5_9ACTN|nr:AAA family ATPase [Haloactinospora alba]TQN33391.1 broad-specificity NMP kinase [Haloactinospora alba]
MNPLVCARCGARVDPSGAAEAALTCVTCGHRQPFRRLPLYCVTGPSGTGKSAVGRLLVDALADRFVVLEQDVLWTAGLRDPTDEHRRFRTTWLRMAGMIQQSGRPVVLCGTVVPPELEPLPERALFSDIHYLALTCEPDTLAARLRARPAWRQWDEPRIAEMLDYAAWVSDTAHRMSPPMTLLDTTDGTVADTASRVTAWIDHRHG